MAGLIPHVFTTKVDAASFDDFAYKNYLITKSGDYIVLVSDNAISYSLTSAGYYLYDLNTGLQSELYKQANLFRTSRSGRAYVLTYTDFGWEANLPCLLLTSSGSLQSVYVLYTKEISTSYTTPPEGFPAVEFNDFEKLKAELDQKLNDALNATTSTTTNVYQINQEITNTYNQYQAGNITYTTVQQNVTNYITQLNELSNLNGNTLADLINITNSLTYAQTVQDAANNAELVNQLQVSSNVSAQVTGKINQANQTFQNYSQGTVTQSEAVTQINQYITQLTNLITPETTTADIEAINAAINTINGIKDSLTNYSDLNNNVAESAQQSDQEEKEYLENITAETTDNINTLKSKVDSSISESQANEVKEQVISPILQNTLIVKVLPIAALFMVLAVTLGFKYKL